MASPRSPPISKKSRASQNHRPSCLLLILAALSASSVAADISYVDHCSDTILESTPLDSLPTSSDSLHLSGGYFSGGDHLFLQDPSPPSSTAATLPRSFYFRARSLRRTQSLGTLHITGTLFLNGEDSPYARRKWSRFQQVPPPRIPRDPRRTAEFQLSGFWSESSGELCMVGVGSARSNEGKPLSLSAVFNLKHPKITTISTSLVKGSLQSLDARNSSNYFDPISLLAYSSKDYEYKKLASAKNSCSRLDLHEESIAFDLRSLRSSLHPYLKRLFKLEYGTGCSHGSCSPFGKTLGFSPVFMALSQIQNSEDGRLHMYMTFPRLNRFAYNKILVPETSLISEGFWDPKMNRLCLLACRIVSNKSSPANASVTDCTIGLSLWLPALSSIKKRSAAVGRIWSNRDKSDPAYFSMVSFRSLDNNMDEVIPGLKYDYTAIDSARNHCKKSSPPKQMDRRYPDSRSIRDMSFDFTVRNAEGSSIWVFATPLFVGDTLYTNSSAMDFLGKMNHAPWNVSYKLACSVPNASLDEIERTEVSAEGIYDAGTGSLCMIGCQYLSSSLLTKTKRRDSSSMDCGILINIQFAPLNREEGDHLTGTIRSTRPNSDPLYFEPLEVSSYRMYTTEAVESVWRMDVEIAMVMISLLLSCIFITLQIFHLKRNPDVLPSMSITMLIILTVGHMIPLLLNFEALFFMNRNRMNVLLWSGGWLEVNEVVVRVMTMVAFMLQLKILQMALSARSVNESRDRLWASERKALRVCLPIYFAGVLIAWFVHLWFSETDQQQKPYLIDEQRHSLWEDLLSYCGLILDGFLLPQIVLNLVWKSKAEEALAPVFYVGTSVVRAMPHLYDAYRARYYVPHLNSSYIYASHDQDFFSTAWDVVVPLEGLLFVGIVYLQQGFGGGCILPPRYRNGGGYAKVPVIGH